jgi:hypothetical protein
MRFFPTVLAPKDSMIKIALWMGLFICFVGLFCLTLLSGYIHPVGNHRPPLFSLYPLMPAFLDFLHTQNIVQDTISAFLCIAVLSCLGTSWTMQMRTAGYTLGVAVIFACALLLHPLMLRALLSGPGAIAKIAFFSLFAHGLYGMRFNPGPLNIMRSGGGLAGMVLSHSVGLIIVIAALPWLFFALPPAWRGVHAWRIYALVLCPAILSCLLTCLFASFMHHPAAVPELSAALSTGKILADTPQVAGGDLFGRLMTAAGYLACTMPVLIVAQLANARKSGLTMVSVILTGVILGAALLDYILLHGQHVLQVMALGIPLGLLALTHGNMVRAPLISTAIALLMAWPLSYLIITLEQSRQLNQSFTGDKYYACVPPLRVRKQEERPCQY